MRQLPLNLGDPPPHTLDSFTAGQNAELLSLLHSYADRNVANPGERFAYLWGETGVGKSHLLLALATAPTARYIHPDARLSAFDFDTATSLYLLDDCHLLSPERQIAAFALFNEVRASDAIMVTTGNAAPMGLSLREDLRTRLGWGLIYQVHGLTDEEKIAALQQIVSVRGLTVSPSVLPYLITHYRRDMHSLASMLDALDRYSLETRRPVTLPLLRELLQLEEHSQEQ